MSERQLGLIPEEELVRCRSCQAPIVWAVTENGRRMPVDADRSSSGNIVLEHREVGKPPVAVYCTFERLDEIRKAHEHNLARGIDDGNDRLYVSHFATCPNAAKHRRR